MTPWHRLLTRSDSPDPHPRLSLLPPLLRDQREPRRWDRPWEDRPGLICCCTSVSAQMYSLGGENTTPAVSAVADKTDFNAETTAAVTTANLSQARWQLASAANPGVAGYFAGGRTGTGVPVGDQTTADKLTFSSDTTAAATTANLSLARAQLYALSERSSKAYFGGGLSASGGTKLNTVDKLTFSGDSTAALGATLSQARSALGGLTEGTSKGYWAGGNTGGGVPSVKTAEKVTFSGDTISALTTAQLSQARFRVFTGSDGLTKGYWAGGQTGGPLSTTDKITFSTDTTAVLTATSFSADSGASGSDGNKLIGLGGSQGLAGKKITFSTDVQSTLGTGSAGNLSLSRTLLAGVSTSAL